MIRIKMKSIRRRRMKQEFHSKGLNKRKKKLFRKNNKEALINVAISLKRKRKWNKTPSEGQGKVILKIDYFLIYQIILIIKPNG